MKPVGESLEVVLGRMEKAAVESRGRETDRAKEAAIRQHNLKVDELLLGWNAPARQSRKKVDRSGPWGQKLTVLEGRLGKGFLSVLYGTNGSGKTQLGVELMKFQIHRREKSARFMSAMDFFMAVKATYRQDSEKGEAQVLDEFAKPSLLVVDEIEKRGESAWENNLLFHLFNRRYNAERDTLLISNLPEAELQAHLGNDLVSRLNETGGMIHCDWPSFR